MPTTDDLQAQFNALATRVSALDGAGLADPSKAAITDLKARLDGLRTTVNQVTLVLEKQLNDIRKQLNDLNTAVTQLTSH